MHDYGGKKDRQEEVMVQTDHYLLFDVDSKAKFLLSDDSDESTPVVFDRYGAAEAFAEDTCRTFRMLGMNVSYKILSEA